MNQTWKRRFQIIKIGGSILDSPESLVDISKIIVSLKNKIFKDHQLVIVVSALKGITNKLIEALKNITNLNIDSFLNDIHNYHLKFANFTEEDMYLIKEEIYSLKNLLYASKMIGRVPDFVYDKVVSSGERWSAVIMEKLLLEYGMKFKIAYPENFLITDGRYGNSSVLLEKSKSALAESISEWQSGDFIVPGFYGKSVTNGDITILGRGGSDYTATSLGYCLDADSVILVKDVLGFLTGDPKITPNAKIVRMLNYEEADELSYFGSKVLHHSAVEPLRLKSIPLYICSIEDLKKLESYESLLDNRINFTVIKDYSEGNELEHIRDYTANCIKSVSMTNDIAIVQFKGHNFGRVPGILGEIASRVALSGVNIKFVITSQTSINLIISMSDLDKVLKLSESLKLKEIEEIKFKKDKVLIAVVGEGLLDAHGIASKIFGAVSRGGINVEMISAGASDVSIYFITDSKDGEKAFKLVHKEFFEDEDSQIKEVN